MIEPRDACDNVSELGFQACSHPNIWDKQMHVPKVFHEMPKIQLQPKFEDWMRDHPDDAREPEWEKIPNPSLQ